MKGRVPQADDNMWNERGNTTCRCKTPIDGQRAPHTIDDYALLKLEPNGYTVAQV